MIFHLPTHGATFGADFPSYVLVASPLVIGAVFISTTIKDWPKWRLHDFVAFHGESFAAWFIYETYENELVPLFFVGILIFLPLFFIIEPVGMVLATMAIMWLLEMKYEKWLGKIYGKPIVHPDYVD